MPLEKPDHQKHGKQRASNRPGRHDDREASGAAGLSRQHLLLSAGMLNAVHRSHQHAALLGHAELFLGKADQFWIRPHYFRQLMLAKTMERIEHVGPPIDAHTSTMIIIPAPASVIRLRNALSLIVISTQPRDFIEPWQLAVHAGFQIGDSGFKRAVKLYQHVHVVRTIDPQLTLSLE
jgi:hypothetical protein